DPAEHELVGDAAQPRDRVWQDPGLEELLAGAERLDLPGPLLESPLTLANLGDEGPELVVVGLPECEIQHPKDVQCFADRCDGRRATTVLGCRPFIVLPLWRRRGPEVGKGSFGPHVWVNSPPVRT